MRKNITLSKTPMPTYKALFSLSFLLLTICLTSFVLGYKLIDIHGHVLSAAAIIIPFRYLLTDLIAEVYGLSVAKKMIWMLVVCGIIFSTVCVLIIKLPSPAYWSHQEDYDFVLGNTLRIALSATVGVILGSMLNVFLLSKWKVLFEGRWFLLRSFLSSLCGELTQYVAVLTMMYWGMLGIDKIIELIIIDYLFQVAFLLFLSPVSHVSLFFIKYIEGVDVYESNISLNPFDLSGEKK
jgi:uncharacterized integral membrane protein (TIGR00697 family)